MAQTPWYSAHSTSSGWTNSANVQASDDARATDPYGFDGAGTGYSTNTLVCTFSGITIPAGVVVSGFEVEIEASKAGSPNSIAATLYAYLSKSGTPAGSTKTVASLTGSDVTTGVGATNDTWGAAWTGSEAQGVRVNIYASPAASGTPSTSDTARVDYVRIRITYEDNVPDAFSFTDQTGVAKSSTITSNSVTITGIDVTTTVSLSGAGSSEWRKNGGSWTSSSGTVVNGDSVQVRHTSSSAFSTVTNTTLTVGGTQDTFSSTTLAQDITPDAFSFTDVTNAEPSTVYDSNFVSITGFNDNLSVSATGGLAGWTGSGGFVSNGTLTYPFSGSLQARGTSSSSFNAAVNVVVNVGGTSDTFTITTRAADTSPSTQTISPKTGAATSTVYAATDVVGTNYITISGVDSGVDVPFTALGGTGTSREYRYDNGGGWTAWASFSGTFQVRLGWKIDLRHTSSGSAATSTTTTATIGGTLFTFTITTAADDDPDDVTFTNQVNVMWGREVDSNGVTVSGLTGGGYTTTVTMASSVLDSYQKVKRNSGSFATSEVAANTDTITCRAVAARMPGFTETITCQIGNRPETWQITTVNALHHPFEV